MRFAIMLSVSIFILPTLSDLFRVLILILVSYTVFCLYGLVSTLVGYLILDPAHMYIYIYIYIYKLLQSKKLGFT